MLKIAHRLYKAQKICDKNETPMFDSNLKLKMSNIKQMKASAQDITECGAKLYNLLGQEEDLKKARENALNFLENIVKQNDNDNNWIKNSVRNLVENQKEQMDQAREEEEEMMEMKAKIEQYSDQLTELTPQIQ